MASFDTGAIFWEATQMLEVATAPDLVLPHRSTNWAMGSTRDVMTWAHMDESGVNTWVRPVSKGAVKYWAVCHYESQDDAASELGSPCLYKDNKDIIVKGTAKSKWEILGICCGDTL